MENSRCYNEDEWETSFESGTEEGYKENTVDDTEERVNSAEETISQGRYNNVTKEQNNLGKVA